MLSLSHTPPIERGVGHKGKNLMTIFQARLITDTLTEEFSYEIYGKDIPSSDAVVEAWKTYAEYEKGCEGDKLSCFSTYSANHQIVEMVAWSESDSKHVIGLLNVRMAIHVTMSFMAWYWRNQYQTARAKEEKSPTLDYAIDADSGYARFRQVTEIAHAHAHAHAKNISLVKSEEIVDMWYQLQNGITLVSKKDGFAVSIRRYVNYEEQHIAIMVTLANKEYFVASHMALLKFFKRHNLLNLHWFSA